jgi:ribonuclease HI
MVGVVFDSSVCSKGHMVGCVIISPSGASFDLSVRLVFTCTNNQAEYEALLCDLECLKDMRVRDVNVFGNSKLVVKHIKGRASA